MVIIIPTPDADTKSAVGTSTASTGDTAALLTRKRKKNAAWILTLCILTAALALMFWGKFSLDSLLVNGSNIYESATSIISNFIDVSYNDPKSIAFRGQKQDEEHQCGWFEKVWDELSFSTYGDNGASLFFVNNIKSPYVSPIQQTMKHADEVFAGKSILVIGGSTSRDLAGDFMKMVLPQKDRELVSRAGYLYGHPIQRIGSQRISGVRKKANQF